MKKKVLTVWIVIFIALLPAVYLALVWDTIPQTVPVHYGADFKPDRMGDKTELWVVTAIMALVSIAIYFLLNNLHRIDPKRKNAGPSPVFNKLAIGLVVFVSAISFIIVASARGVLEMQNLLFPLMGLMFAFIGNYMNNIKPNYFAGLRLPWTLSSDENWRRTHHLAGKLWFAGGILIILAGFLLPPSAMWIVFISLMVVMVLIPVIYSYRLFKQQV